MKKKLHFLGNKCVLFLLVFFLSQNIFGQAGSIDAGLSLGPSNLLSDLGGNAGKGTSFLKDNNFSQTRFIGGAHVTFNAKDWLSYRLALNVGSLSGDDAIIKGKGGYEEARKLRNQNVRTPLVEFMALAEVFPTVFWEADPSDTYRKLRPYATIGLGGFYFNPKGKDPLTGEWVTLKALHTEGQGFLEHSDRKEYSLVQLNIPMGIGVKYFLTDRSSVSLEVLHRVTFTDYIDDVSTNYIDPNLYYNYLPTEQAALAERMADKRNNGLYATRAGEKRGTSTNNDAYYSVNVKFSFQLRGSDNGMRNSTRCPIIRF